MVKSDKAIIWYSDSKWCVDILQNIERYSKGKQPSRHHNVWEDMYAMVTTTSSSFQERHVYLGDVNVYMHLGVPWPTTHLFFHRIFSLLLPVPYTNLFF